ncbi:unnamed protein product [Sphagnum jensenii]|uniref:Uncharacterized protein n=1 Tax=Sphagnum jensenii TaxID=128206 RepID=A0ABP0VBD4_9BRYO
MNKQNAKRLAWSLTSDDAIMAFMDNHPNADKALGRLAEALELPDRPTAQPVADDGYKWPRLAELTMTARQLFDALSDALQSGAVDDTDNISLIQRDGKLIPLHPFNEDAVYKGGNFEMRPSPITFDFSRIIGVQSSTKRTKSALCRFMFPVIRISYINKGYNIYALGQYMARVKEIVADIKRGADVRKAVVRGFNGRIAAACLKALKLPAYTKQDAIGSGVYRPVTPEPAE